MTIARLLPVALLATVATPGAGACLLGGLVVDAQSGKPLPRTKVLARRHLKWQEPVILHVTDAQGTFCFERLEPDDYELRAVRDRYLDAIHGARPGSDHGVWLTVDGRSQAPSVTLKMVPAAAIAGAVLDAAGQPRGETFISLHRKIWDKGWTSETVANTATDDRGMFRFSQLAPGNYYLSADPRGGRGRAGSMLDEKGAPVNLVEVPTFFSGSLSFAHATPVPLVAGQEVDNVMLAISRAGTRRLTGTLSPEFEPLPGQKPTLFVRASRGGSFEVPVSAEGSFSADDLLPSVYTIQLHGVKSGTQLDVDLREGDVNGLVIRRDAGYEVRIATRAESGELSQNVHLVMWNLDDATEYYSISAPRSVSVFRTVRPGRYRLSADGGPWYLKSLSIDGRLRADATLDLSRGPGGTIEAMLSPDVATAEGSLREGVKPALAVTVIWIDESKTRTQVSGDWTEADNAGNWKIPWLAPGKYRLFAVEGFEEGPWGSMELCDALREKSVVIEVREKDKPRIAMPLISADEWSAALRKVGM